LRPEFTVSQFQVGIQVANGKRALQIRSENKSTAPANQNQQRVIRATPPRFCSHLPMFKPMNRQHRHQQQYNRNQQPEK